MKNKTHVEGSICEAYIVEEMLFFANHFFEKKNVLPNKRMKARRNTEGVSKDLSCYSILNCPIRGQGQMIERWLLQEELHSSYTYIS